LFIGFSAHRRNCRRLFFEPKKDGAGDEKMAVMMERLANLGAQNEEMRKALDAKLSEAYKTSRINSARPPA